jgi:hypothetical protein
MVSLTGCHKNPKMYASKLLQSVKQVLIELFSFKQIHNYNWRL